MISSNLYAIKNCYSRGSECPFTTSLGTILNNTIVTLHYNIYCFATSGVTVMTKRLSVIMTYFSWSLERRFKRTNDFYNCIILLFITIIDIVLNVRRTGRCRGTPADIVQALQAAGLPEKTGLTIDSRRPLAPTYRIFFYFPRTPGNLLITVGGSLATYCDIFYNLFSGVGLCLAVIINSP